MRKDLGTKGAMVTPLPVLIIGTYDENGVADAMNVAWGGQCSEKHVAINIGHVRKTRDNIMLKRAHTSFRPPTSTPPSLKSTRSRLSAVCIASRRWTLARFAWWARW